MSDQIALVSDLYKQIVKNSTFRKPSGNSGDFGKSKAMSPKPKKADFKRKNVESKKGKKKGKNETEKVKKQGKNKSKKKQKSKNNMRASLDLSSTKLKAKFGRSPPKKMEFSQSNKMIHSSGRVTSDGRGRFGA